MAAIYVSSIISTYVGRSFSASFCQNLIIEFCIFTEEDESANCLHPKQINHEAVVQNSDDVVGNSPKWLIQSKYSIDRDGYWTKVHQKMQLPLSDSFFCFSFQWSAWFSTPNSFQKYQSPGRMLRLILFSESPPHQLQNASLEPFGRTGTPPYNDTVLVFLCYLQPPSLQALSRPRLPLVAKLPATAFELCEALVSYSKQKLFTNLSYSMGLIPLTPHHWRHKYRA